MAQNGANGRSERARRQRLRVVAGTVRLDPGQRKQLHTRLVGEAELPSKIAEARADYKKALKQGGLRRASAAKRHG